MTARAVIWWLPLAGLVALQISYPLVGGSLRSTVVVCTVVWGFAFALTHATVTRGVGTGGVLLGAVVGGGFAIEAIGVATGFPFGRYDYSASLGPRLLGVPVVIPLAWAWMAWPAWLAAGLLTRRTPARVVVAGWGLAAWDLFLDPQMVAAGYWHWACPCVGLPGVASVPIGNYLGWLGVALLMMAALAAMSGTGLSGTDRAVASRTDVVMFALYLWMYAASVVAHAIFLDLPASAWWGALGMGVVALPLAVRLARARRLAKQRRLAQQRRLAKA